MSGSQEEITEAEADELAEQILAGSSSYRAVLRCRECEQLTSEGADPGQSLGELMEIDGSIVKFRTAYQNNKTGRGSVTEAATIQVKPTEFIHVSCHRKHRYKIPGKWIIDQFESGKKETSGKPWERTRTVGPRGDSIRIPERFLTGGRRG